MPSPRCAPFINAKGMFNSQMALDKLNTAQRGACDLEAMKVRAALKPSAYAQGGRRTRKHRKGRKGGKSRRNRH
jgi:hypothetical protein